MTADTSSRPIELQDGDDIDDLVAREPIVLLEFYTNNCGICQSIEPVLGHVHRETNVTVGVCNPQTDMGLVDRFSITSVPTLVLFYDGEQLATLSEGFQGAEAILSFVESNLPPNATLEGSIVG
ncbi:thioredoxin domain protein [Halalkaliarchaeum desulfuricum]|uniref:Thioredoxin domain protein n=1 Tax=Halalkaliarchaeum desulfuricum TaxID=2055893 RepID=A0A343TF80_9EURY|nr:thioredoxin family protein [Halalkaliarchaeum desulfuricum]AUX07752.1 thioredoxin domain protein [Halalkaliarchaeum desulfuricum]